MELCGALREKGFEFVKAEPSDIEDYMTVKKACYKTYVDEYFGGWADDTQRKMNKHAFADALGFSCFEKILLNGETVGFLAYDEQTDGIDGITIQMLDHARNKGIGAFYLNQITALSNNTKKPVLLKVFLSNPAQNLYKRHGFKVYDQNSTHYYMRYEPS